ncbi:MAG: glycosyltransferase family 39 protein, partial [Candidatus Hydrogenedentota bacterium]
PLLAIVIGITTPAFVVSSTNVMAEIMMVCFYVWAIHFWMLGIEKKKNAYLFIGALCIAASTLAKYFGFSLIPLLFVYTLLEIRKPGWWLAHLATAVGIVLLYEAWTLYMYDIGLLGEAANFATSYRDENEVSRNTKAFVGLAFTGGCIAIVTLLSPLLFSRKWQLSIWATGLYFFFVAYNYPHIFQEQDILRREYNDWNFILHFTIFCVAGLFVLLLPILDLFTHRNKQSVFLFLWVMGTFLFATQVNWTANARSIVPMAPAIGILIGRRLSHVHGDLAFPIRRVGASLTAAVLLAITLAYADYTLARAGKQAATKITQEYGDEDTTLRFTGHWGNQYYMMQTPHFQPLVYLPTDFKKGDVLVICDNNTGLFLTDEQRDFAETTEFDIFPYATVWCKSHRTGFYSDIWGSIPYSFGAIPDEAYHVLISGSDMHVDLGIYKPGSSTPDPIPLL